MDNIVGYGTQLTLKNFFGWAWALFRSPKEFFRNLDREGGYGVPIFYALGWQFLAGLVWFLMSLIRPSAMPFGLPMKIFWVVLGPGAVLVTGFVLAGGLFVLWHLMGSSYGYRTAFRFWAFATPVGVIGAVFNLVPYLSLVVLFYRFFLLVTASIEGHGISTRKAWTVWSLLLGVVVCVQLLGAAVLLFRQKLMGSGANFPFGGPQSSLPSSFNRSGESPEEAMKKVQEAIAKHKAEFDKMQRENPPPPTGTSPKPIKPKPPVK